MLQAYIAYVFKNEHAMAKAEAEELDVTVTKKIMNLQEWKYK